MIGYQHTNQLHQQMPNLVVKNLVMIRTRDNYKNQWTRGYHLDLKPADVSKLEDMFHRHGVNKNSKINEAWLAKEMPNLMSISAGVETRVDIVNSWNTERLQFRLEVETNGPEGNIISYIQGYTEYYDPTITGKIDDNMYFYINSITNLIKTVDPVTNTFKVSPYNTYNVISNKGVNKLELTDGIPLKTVRPGDIFNNLENMSVFESDDHVVAYDHSNDYGTTITSKKANNDPIRHFVSTTNAYVGSKAMSNISSEQSDIFSGAQYLVNETSISNIPFMVAMFNMFGVADDNKFTLNQLQQLDPNTPNVSQILTGSLGDTQTGIGVLDTQETAEMHTPNIETVIANNLCNTVNATFADNMIGMGILHITNLSGSLVATLLDARPLIEYLDLTYYINRVIARIEHVIYPMISQSGLIGLDIYVYSDVMSETTVAISVNGEPPITYRFPMFADSLFSPVITTPENSQMLVNDFSTVMDLTYSGAPSPSYPLY